MQFGRWCYFCGYGVSLFDFVFDFMLYIDLFLNDFGVKVYCKVLGIIEIVELYKFWDYVGIFEEWGEKYQKGGSVKINGVNGVMNGVQCMDFYVMYV